MAMTPSPLRARRAFFAQGSALRSAPRQESAQQRVFLRRLRRNRLALRSGALAIGIVLASSPVSVASASQNGHPSNRGSGNHSHSKTKQAQAEAPASLKKYVTEMLNATKSELTAKNPNEINLSGPSGHISQWGDTHCPTGNSGNTGSVGNSGRVGNSGSSGNSGNSGNSGSLGNSGNSGNSGG
jgi:hypothetical protein